MKKFLVTATPEVNDVIQLEPTLEALYYAHAPCQLFLRTWEGYIPFFEHHPLVAEVIVLTEEEPTDFDIYLNISSSPSPSLSTVEKFAARAGVYLLRKTPKIFLKEWPEDSDVVVQTEDTQNIGEVSRLFDLVYIFEELQDYLRNNKVVKMHQPEDNQGVRECLQVLAGALLVVGHDGWMTQAAAALDARVVMGILPGDEARKLPFNVTATNLEPANAVKAVKEVLYEKRYPEFMNVGNAAEWIKNKAKQYMKSNFVDVGCSAWPIPNGIPVDMGNRKVIEEAPDECFSGVFSSHCLEHIVDWEKELNLWHRITRKDGYIFLYLPHPRAEVWHANTGSWVGPHHVWNPEPVTLVRYLKEVLSMDIIEYTSRRDPLWSFYIVAKKV